MASKRENHKKRSHPLPSARTSTRQTGSFRMVVAASPGSALSIAPELDLVKAALLYGDKVTLISPVTTMLLRVEDLKQFSPREQIDLLRRVAPILMPADQAPDFQQGLAQIEGLLSSPGRDGSWRKQLLRMQILQQFEPIRQRLADAVEDIGDQAGLNQLARARAQGLVRIESADPGDAMDLLVSCIAAAKLAETGEKQVDPHTNQIVETFVEKLSRHLSSGREYLIFDQPVANLTEAAIREGLFSPAKGSTGRSAQAMGASALMGRLPTFPNATVDDVLDIRMALAPSLTPFRSAMATISKTFTSAAWESDFADEVHDVWVERVLPAVEAIDASVRDDTSLLSLAAGIAGTTKASYPGLAIVAAGLLGHDSAAAALGGAVYVAGPLLQALRNRKAAVSNIRMQPFYFLYAMEQALN